MPAQPQHTARHQAESSHWHKGRNPSAVRCGERKEGSRERNMAAGCRLCPWAPEQPHNHTASPWHKQCKRPGLTASSLRMQSHAGTKTGCMTPAGHFPHNSFMPRHQSCACNASSTAAPAQHNLQLLLRQQGCRPAWRSPFPCCQMPPHAPGTATAVLPVSSAVL